MEPVSTEDQERDCAPPGESRLELLPPMILEKVIGQITDFNDIHRLLAVSRTIANTAEEVCFGKIEKIVIEIVPSGTEGH